MNITTARSSGIKMKLKYFVRSIPVKKLMAHELLFFLH